MAQENEENIKENEGEKFANYFHSDYYIMYIQNCKKDQHFLLFSSF